MRTNKEDNLLVTGEPLHILQPFEVNTKKEATSYSDILFSLPFRELLKIEPVISRHIRMSTFVAHKFGAVSLLRRGLLLRCQTLTSPRRRRRDVHPECFPPAPKCCTCVNDNREESSWRRALR